MSFSERVPGIGVRVSICVLALVAVTAASSLGAGAAPQMPGEILYQDPASFAGTVAAPVQLWATDGSGQHAKRILALPPSSDRPFWGAHLGVRGSVFYAQQPSKSAQAINLYQLSPGAKHGRMLFGVRGLILFAPSPDGREIAYIRNLPVAGKPLLVVARVDGTKPKIVAPIDGHTLSWSADGKTLFVYGVQESAVCWFCAISVSTGKMRAIKFPYANMQGWPSVSPDGHRFAFWNLKGPAGERIYMTAGSMVRNIVGVGGAAAIWSPDNTKLILQGPGSQVVDLSTKIVRPFRHGGPSGLHVLDWAAD